MNWQNDITQILQSNYPLVQAPMFGVTTPEMVAAANRAGCLGSLPLGDLPVERCLEIIRSAKQLTNCPFAVNLFVNQIPEQTEELKTKYENAKRLIEQLALQHRVEVILPTIDQLIISSYHEQVDVILAEGIRIVSFTFGNLDRPSIQRLKSKGVILIGTCTSVREAEELEASDIDLICVQGLEAGGHRGSFSTEDIPKIGGLSLLSQVYEAVSVPFIYAGGLYNAKTLVAVRLMGAQGFQIGSLLLGSEESALKPFEKERLRRVKEDEIVLTKSFSGRYARGIRNTFIEALEHTDIILPYPYQNKLTGELRKVAKAANNTEFVSIWLGQSINEFSNQSTTEILQGLVAQTEAMNLS